MGDQVKGHTRVFAILNSDVQVRPATVMVSKVTVTSEKYTNILMGTVQAAIAHGVLDAVRAGDIPKNKANDLGIIVSVWLDPSVIEARSTTRSCSRRNREATAKAIHKAMHHEPSIDWLLKNQDEGAALLPPVGAGRETVVRPNLYLRIYVMRASIMVMVLTLITIASSMRDVRADDGSRQRCGKKRTINPRHVLEVLDEKRRQVSKIAR